MKRTLIFMVALMLLLVGVVGAFGSVNELEPMETVGVIMPTIAVSASKADSVMPQSYWLSPRLAQTVEVTVAMHNYNDKRDCYFDAVASVQARTGMPLLADGGVATRLIFIRPAPIGVKGEIIFNSARSTA